MPAYQNDVKVVLNNQSKTPDNINDLIDYYNSTLQTNMLHYNVRQSHCEPIHPGTRVHYVGRRGRAGGVKE